MWLECCLKVRCSCPNNTRDTRKSTGLLSLPEDIKCSKINVMLQELTSLGQITVFSSSLLGVIKFLFQLNGSQFICYSELTSVVCPQTGKVYRKSTLCIYYYFTNFPIYFGIQTRNPKYISAYLITIQAMSSST